MKTINNAQANVVVVTIYEEQKQTYETLKLKSKRFKTSYIDIYLPVLHSSILYTFDLSRAQGCVCRISQSRIEDWLGHLRKYRTV